jgi:predicted Zn-dependent protease
MGTPYVILLLILLFLARGGFPAEPISGELPFRYAGRGQGSTPQETRNSPSPSDLQRYLAILKQNPNDFTANLNVGLILLRQGKPESAIPYLNKASASQPHRPEPYIARANAYIDLNDLGKALVVLQNGVSACARLPEYWIMRASLEISLSRIESAKTSLLRARDLQPPSADLRFRMGILFFQAGEAKQAEEQLRFSALQAPSHIPYVREWVNVLIQSHDKREAQKTLLEFAGKSKPPAEVLALVGNGLHRLGSTQEALTLLQEAIPASDDPAPLYTEIAFIYHSTGKKEDAENAIAQALARNPDYPPALALRAFLKLEAGDLAGAAEDALNALRKNPTLADAHRTCWSAFYRLGQIQKAESALRAWISAVPLDPAPYQALADLLYRQKRYAEAGALTETALKLLPNDPHLLTFLAQAYASAGLSERTAQILQKAVDQGVKHPDVFVRLALAYRQTGKNALAIATLRVMRAHYPEDERAWLLEATTHEQAGNFLDAARVYREYLQREPNSLFALEGVARSLSRAGRHEESARAWLDLADKYPEVIPAYYDSAREFHLANKNEEADSVWRTLFQRRPDDPNGLYAYAQFLLETNRKETALQVYERLQQAHPENPLGYLASAEVYQKEGNLSEAASVLLKGMKNVFRKPSPPEGSSDAPDHFKLLEVASRLLEQAGRLAEYDQALEDIIQGNRFTPAPLLAYVNSAHRRGALPSARQTLSKALSENPQNGFLFLALARLEALGGNASSALLYLERAAELLPKDLSTVKTFAESAEAARDAVRAAKGYALLIQIVPNEPGYRLKYAAYLMELGDTAKARTVLIESAQLFPENQEIQNLLSRLPPTPL